MVSSFFGCPGSHCCAQCELSVFGGSCRPVCLPDLNCIGLSLNLGKELFMYYNMPGLLMYLLIIFEN